jgi:hypothetical protein
MRSRTGKRVSNWLNSTDSRRRYCARWRRRDRRHRRDSGRGSQVRRHAVACSRAQQVLSRTPARSAVGFGLGKMPGRGRGGFTPRPGRNPVGGPWVPRSCPRSVYVSDVRPCWPGAGFGGRPGRFGLRPKCSRGPHRNNGSVWGASTPRWADWRRCVVFPASSCRANIRQATQKMSDLVLGITLHSGKARG